MNFNKEIKLKFDDNYNSRLFATQADTGRVFYVQIMDADNSPVNVAGHNLDFYVGNDRQVSKVSATIKNAAEGIFEVATVNSQFKYHGLHKAQFVLKDSAGKKIGSKIIPINIESSLENGATVGKNVIVDFETITKAITLVEKFNATYDDAKKTEGALKTGIADLAKLNKSATEVDGNIKKNMEVVKGWIANPEQFKGERGLRGLPGKDGVSVTHEFSGTVLSVTSASGTTIADLKGDKGDPGQGLSILGKKTNTWELPGSANMGDAYFVGTELYVWTGNRFENMGNIKGERGEQGPRGERGADGRDGTSVTHRWNDTWLTLTSAGGSNSVNLKGERGEQGPRGERGAQGPRGENATTTEVATRDHAGLMSARDAKKLEGIPSEMGFSKNVINQYTSSLANPGTYAVTNCSDIPIGADNLGALVVLKYGSGKPGSDSDTVQIYCDVHGSMWTRSFSKPQYTNEWVRIVDSLYLEPILNAITESRPKIVFLEQLQYDSLSEEERRKRDVLYGVKYGD